ncbi:major pollen allergen Bet v 1-D/H-like [Tasmannia lanceolata]|uniref:major pollen allergen Bet v 1-D/H-like n=1 Tax=Tasmannia lanceolata TaxID=3420 RepID=UPI004063EAB1
MVVGHFLEETSYPFPALKLWKAMCDMHNLMPKVMPEFIASVVVLEGSGGVGTVKKTKFTEAVKDFKYTKERVDVIDHDKFVYKYTIIEGGLCGQIVKWYSFDMKLESVGDGCVAKMKVEYDSLGDSLLTDDQIAQIKAGNQGMAKAVQAYLQANPALYA